MKNAYNIALGDWFNPPVIHRVARYGGALRIWATDDVRVAGVQVLVLDEEEKVLEMGDATQGRGDWWEYVLGIEGKAVVEARDLTVYDASLSLVPTMIATLLGIPLAIVFLLQRQRPPANQNSEA